MARQSWLVLLVGFLLVAAAAPGCIQLGDDASAQFTPSQVQTENVPEDENSVAAGYFAGVLPWDQGEGVVPVTTVAASELYPGDGKFTQAVAAIPFLAPKADASRGVSNLADSADYYYAEHVNPSEVQGHTFDPSTGAAYACYELALPGSGPTTIGVAWYSLPTDMACYYIGIGDLAANTWHWYMGPDDGVLTFDPADWGGIRSGSVLVCVALEGGKLADFWSLKAGVSEMRGTGLAFEEPPAGKTITAAPVSAAAASLPDAVDLSAMLHPIRNQGSMGSCTAFACTDASLGILLNKVYGSEGWDTTDDSLKPSPMWAYVKSGVPPIGNWNPICGSNVGRYMSEALNVLADIGAAMEETVPYYATGNCSTVFPPAADTEASLVQISDWYSIGGTGLDEGIKAQLASLQRPVVIAMYKLEYAFINYSSGVYHFNPGGSYVNAGHAMCIVGYDDSLAAFKIRNSWGSAWGQGGYWWCSYDSIDQMAALGRFYAYVMELEYNPAAASHFLGSAPITIDELEPNNDPSTANSLPPFPLDGYTGQLGGNDGADCFTFNRHAGYATEFSAQATGSLCVRLELYDSAGHLVYRPAEDDPQDAISGLWTEDGSAVLRVQWLSGEGYYLLDATERKPPTTPTGLRASDKTRADAVELSWQASPDADSYIVERAVAVEGPFTRLGSTYNATYLDTGAQHWQHYFYRLAASSGGGASAFCEPVQGARQAPTPANLRASDGNHADRVVITWQPVAQAEAVYTVRRSMMAEGPFTVVGRTNGAFLEDTAVDFNVPFFYTVSASVGDFAGPPSVADSGFRRGPDPYSSMTQTRVVPNNTQGLQTEQGKDDASPAVVDEGNGSPPVQPK